MITTNVDSLQINDMIPFGGLMLVVDEIKKSFEGVRLTLVHDEFFGKIKVTLPEGLFLDIKPGGGETDHAYVIYDGREPAYAKILGE